MFIKAQFITDGSFVINGKIHYSVAFRGCQFLESVLSDISKCTYEMFTDKDTAIAKCEAHNNQIAFEIENDIYVTLSKIEEFAKIVFIQLHNDYSPTKVFHHRDLKDEFLKKIIDLLNSEFNITINTNRFEFEDIYYLCSDWIIDNKDTFDFQIDLDN